MSIQRREKLLGILRDEGYVNLHDLEERFPDCSSMTLRRDLEFFENIGEAARVRGGAKYIGHRNAVEDIYELREIKNRDAKEYIADKAVKFAETGCSLFIDAGTTGMVLAKFLPDTPYYILTSGPNVAVEIAKKFKPRVTVVGGEMNRSNLAVSGTQALEFIKNFNIETAFVVASAFSPESGFTCGNANECELKKAVVKKAKKVVMLADSAKFGKSLPYTFAVPEDIDALITEREPDIEILNILNEKSVQIVY